VGPVQKLGAQEGPEPFKLTRGCGCHQSRKVTKNSISVAAGGFESIECSPRMIAQVVHLRRGVQHKLTALHLKTGEEAQESS